ncbi:hypothetical protein ENUP19_0121G0001 [Entamoeba nuttalli]|uniref:Uncharacterized protein n=1 Tax=Entamoeba nuttalli TaxID=412467 RepID=A0ABQ0DIG2_9EUKA
MVMYLIFIYFLFILISLIVLLYIVFLLQLNSIEIPQRFYQQSYSTRNRVKNTLETIIMIINIKGVMVIKCSIPTTIRSTITLITRSTKHQSTQVITENIITKIIIILEEGLTSIIIEMNEQEIGRLKSTHAIEIYKKEERIRTLKGKLEKQEKEKEIKEIKERDKRNQQEERGRNEENKRKNRQA